MMKKNKHIMLWVYFSLVVFATVLVSFALMIFIWFLLYKFNVVNIKPTNFAGGYTYWFIILGSLLVGVANAIFVSNVFIKPIEKLNDKFYELSKGNFSIRVSENKSIKEIREMAKCFNSMVDELANLETLRTDFVANVSHEFKTPISAIQGYATLLQANDLTPKEHDTYVQKVIDNSTNLSSLLNNMLFLSKLENQKTNLKKTKYRLDEQIRESILLLENKWTDKNIEFNISLPTCIFIGDKELLNQVWVNIIDNAIKYSNLGGTIGVKLVTSLSSVAITIYDNGYGIGDEEQKHLFEKFYQCDTSHKSDGYGLGLSIVKRITDLCDGEISVTSKLGKGTAFTVILPRSIMTLAHF